MRNNENNTKLNFSEWKVLQPSHIQIEDQDAFDRSMNYSEYMTHGDPWKNGYHSFKNHLRALNSLRRYCMHMEACMCVTWESCPESDGMRCGPG